MRFISSILIFSLFQLGFSQRASIKGKVISNERPIPSAAVYLRVTTSEIDTLYAKAFTDANGEFLLEQLPSANYTLEIVASGYYPFSEEVSLKEFDELHKTVELFPDVLNLSEVVVTATRGRVARYNAPVLVHAIGAKTFENTQSISISDGLSFSPGLRLENNCQNCGFTQLRMNGLDGAYSQILINSRPVFSALAGVYGLELIPATMVERIEVIRGGGSVLFGGNAIAGTVNIITKDPIENSFELSLNQAFIKEHASDRTLSLNGAVVDEKANKGISFFGFNRERDPWDANGDGFSELTKIQNTTFGWDTFWKPSERSKLKWGLYKISEFRRGGNGFDLAPHQTDIAEQLQHEIISTNLSFEQISRNQKHKFTAYAAAQWIDRDSYYGGGGRILQPGEELTPDDILALNAYGNSKDFSAMGGLQQVFQFHKRLSFTSGVEFVHNRVEDRMPGYNRKIDQRVQTLGAFSQMEWNPTEKWSLLIGGRYDGLNIQGRYLFQNETFENHPFIGVFVPRLTAMYKWNKNFKIRSSFAQGYRGPQAFDEDLHVETVGGAARFIRLDPNLQTERSNSYLLSFNYEKTTGRRQFSVVTEGFLTELVNPFILSDQVELPNGIAVVTKRNGSGAVVAGVNLEANVAFSNRLIIQSGATFQTARYSNTETLWQPTDPLDTSPATTTDEILRTPNAYGYLTLSFTPSKRWSFAYSSTFTGSMPVPHVVDPETERLEIKRTPFFWENNFRLSHTFRAGEHYFFQLFGGVQNIFNSFQRDFDVGPLRDAGYIYGPLRPRTIFFGLKLGMD